jgi:MHS family proline/betaine transporter-like MFS transporter
MRDAKAVAGRIKATIVVAVAVGNAMEWYDFALTAFLATQLAKNFFPHSTSVSGLLNVLVVFGIAFVFRPLGGFLLGPLADRRGRMLALLLTLGIMACSTFMVGVLPTEHEIGIASPILLVLFRIVQGFSAGAESGTAVTYLVEHAPAHRKGFVSSFVQASSILGFLIASLVIWVVTSLLDHDEMIAWGWRIPFLLALPFGLVGLYIRFRLEETPEFKTLVDTGRVKRNPLVSAVAENWRTILLIAAMSAVQNVGYYTAFAYFPGHMARLGFASPEVALATTLTLICAVLIVPAFGALSDLKGRRPVLLSAAAVLLVLPIPLFAAMARLGLPGVVACQLVMAGAVAAYNSTTGAAYAEISETATRAATLSIGFNIGTVLFAAPTLYVMTWLNTTFTASWAPGVYLALSAALSLIAVAALPKKRSDTIPENDVSAHKAVKHG